MAASSLRPRRLSVLVVDDEPHERRGLAAMVAGFSGYRVIGECGDGVSAVRAIRELAPEIVLLDVQMPPPNGMNVVRTIGPERMPAVVFVTAHDAYAVQAFEAHAVDYVLKPFTERRMLAALEHARALHESRRLGDLAARLLKVLGEPAPGDTDDRSRIVVKSIGRTELIPVADIVRVEASRYCVILHIGQRTVVHRASMAELERRLPASDFLRVHRSEIVNLRHVARIRVLTSGDRELVLTNGSKVRVSRSRWPALEAHIGLQHA